MGRPLEEYHALEDGELNRLWYEEQDPRARDAFRLRWWMGGDPIAGKDLFDEYHDLVYRRCLERHVLLEEEIERVFRSAVDKAVDRFPSEPIPKFEDFLLPLVDEAIDEILAGGPKRGAVPEEEARAAVEKALAGEEGDLLRRWIEHGEVDGDEEALGKAWAAMGRLVEALWGEEAAGRHPVVAVPEPPPRKLDPSVAVPHFTVRQILLWAAASENLSKQERDHLEWDTPCRERCVGARELLRRLRALFGKEAPPPPSVSPELKDRLNRENPRIPPISSWNAGRAGVARAGAAEGDRADPSGRSSVPRAALVVALLLAAIAVAYVALR